MKEIEKFLEQQFEGQLVDADVEFSLSPEQAGRKIAPFQQAVPAYGPLRILQALHLLDTRSVAIEMSDTSLKIVANGEFPADLTEKAEAAFTGVGLFADTEFANLAVGLHALKAVSPKSLAFTHAGKYWEVVGDAPGQPSPSRAVLEIRAEFAAWASAAVLKELKKRCRFVRYGLSFNQETLNRQLARSKSQGPETMEDRDYLTEWVAPGVHFQYPIAIIDQYKTVREVRTLQKLMPTTLSEMGPVIYGGLPADFQGSSIGADAVVAFFFARDETSDGALVALQHGIVAEVLTEKRFPECTTVIADAGSLQTDLSGLRIVRNAQYEQFADKLQNTVKTAARATVEHLPEALKTLAIGSIQHQKEALQKVQGSGCLFALLGFMGANLKLEEMAGQLSTSAGQAGVDQTERLKQWLQTV